MPDEMDRRDALADALEERGWEGVEIDGEQVDRAELTVAVTPSGITVDRVEITDEDGLTDDQRAVLDEVSEEKLSGPELTVWEYEPGAREDDVESVREEIRDVWDDVTPV